MSDLLREIRSAQIKAGEGAVCAHLDKLGLVAEKVADVQRPLNALKITAAPHDEACPSYVRLDAAEMLRQQHAEIERLTALNSALTAERDIVIAVAAAERETCARICETSSSLEEAAHLIRARSAK